MNPEKSPEKKPKVIAYLLPQFHRIAENDAWWGEGFTEWTNVRKARALFAGHNQPRIPTDDNYYDLSSPETQRWQASLAKQHGISGFCYYHYWFSGKQLLELPVNSLLDRGEPDFPYCLAWANEPWTRTWDGGDRDVLMPQRYGDQNEWHQHFAYLVRAFKDPRYICVDGKPVFLIYRTASIRDCAAMLACWRELAMKAGLPGLHVVSMRTYFEDDPRSELFDAFVEFEPMFSLVRLPWLERLSGQLFNKLNRLSWRLRGEGKQVPTLASYRALWSVITRRLLPAKHYPGAFVDWDNTPRKGGRNSLVMRWFSLETFADGFNRQFKKAQTAGADFIFINAWNEWAEGTYLEPDQTRGTACLEAIRDVAQPVQPVA